MGRAKMKLRKGQLETNAKIHIVDAINADETYQRLKLNLSTAKFKFDSIKQSFIDNLTPFDEIVEVELQTIGNPGAWSVYLKNANTGERTGPVGTIHR